MGLFNKKKVKEQTIDMAKDHVKNKIQDAVEEKIAEAAAEKTVDYALQNASAGILPWWILFVWWPVKMLALLITWPIRALLRKRK